MSSFVLNRVNWFLSINAILLIMALATGCSNGPVATTVKLSVPSSPKVNETANAEATVECNGGTCAGGSCCDDCDVVYRTSFSWSWAEVPKGATEPEITKTSDPDDYSKKEDVNFVLTQNGTYKIKVEATCTDGNSSSFTDSFTASFDVSN